MNCRQAREGALGYKVNCAAREGALGYEVNCAAREGPPEELLGMSHSSPSALGYEVNCRQAREGPLGCSMSFKLMSLNARTHSLPPR